MSYKYKWKPSKAQKKEFAENMQNPDFAQAYHKRKEDKAKKRREASNFDYATAGGQYVPTKAQHDFCLNNNHLFADGVEQDAANEVMYGYTCQEKINHDFIHIVNEKRRANPNI